MCRWFGYPSSSILFTCFQSHISPADFRKTPFSGIRSFMWYLQRSRPCVKPSVSFIFPAPTFDFFHASWRGALFFHRNEFSFHTPRWCSFLSPAHSVVFIPKNTRRLSAPAMSVLFKKESFRSSQIPEVRMYRQGVCRNYRQISLFPLLTMSFCNQIPCYDWFFCHAQCNTPAKSDACAAFIESFQRGSPLFLTFQAHTKADLGNDLILAFPEPYSPANAVYSQYINLLYSIFGVAFEAKCDKGFFSTFFKKGVDKNKFTWYNNKADSGQ